MIYTLVIVNPMRKTLKFILTKISKKSRKSKHFSYILIHFEEIIESHVRKYKSYKITLKMSFLSYI